MNAQAVDQYFKDNRESHLDELKKFLRIPSVSSLSEHKADMQKGAEWLITALESAGLENAKIDETDGHPVVYADWLHAEGKPTVLVYGHYDVQPVDPLNLWETPPFDPHVRDIETRMVVGESSWRIFRFHEFVHRIAEVVTTNPNITHCEDPACERCNDMVAGGPTLP